MFGEVVAGCLACREGAMAREEVALLLSGWLLRCVLEWNGGVI